MPNIQAMRMMIFSLFFIFLLFAMAKSTNAANWYVRPSGGSGSGANWTAAWNGLSAINWSSVACGDTIWVAGGTYTQSLNPQKNCNSGAQLNIRRARSDAAECTNAAGWNSAYDSNITQTNSGINMGSSAYVNISGATNSYGGNIGWRMNCPGYTGENYIINAANAAYCKFEYLETEGPGYVNYSGDSRGISVSGGSGHDLTFSHIFVHKSTSAIFLAGPSNVVFEYIEMTDCSAVNAASWHPNGIWAARVSNLTVRYSYFHKGVQGYGVGEGIFSEQSGGNSNWKIYGNIFADVTKGIQISSPITSLLIYNNTYYRVGQPQPTFTDNGSCGSGSANKNNLDYGGSGMGNCGTNSNNLTSTSNPFTNSSAGDFHIISNTGGTYPRNAGTSLGSDFSNDKDGKTRGADGAWDIGAYEYASSTCTPSCSGKVCGDNGCGGSCGTCTIGQSCVNGACVSSNKPGDANNDGKVDIFDFNIVVQNFGSSVCSNPADFDKTCKVDIFDYNILLLNFGK